MSRWIEKWDPEDVAFWGGAKARRIARRNLCWSILAENIGFSVWLVWSITATRLPSAGFHYTTDQLFALVSCPASSAPSCASPIRSRCRASAGATGRW